MSDFFLPFWIYFLEESRERDDFTDFDLSIFYSIFFTFLLLLYYAEKSFLPPRIRRDYWRLTTGSSSSRLMDANLAPQACPRSVAFRFLKTICQILMGQDPKDIRISKSEGTYLKLILVPTGLVPSRSLLPAEAVTEGPPLCFCSLTVLGSGAPSWSDFLMSKPKMTKILDLWCWIYLYNRIRCQMVPVYLPWEGFSVICLFSA